MGRKCRFPSMDLRARGYSRLLALQYRVFGTRGYSVTRRPTPAFGQLFPAASQSQYSEGRALFFEGRLQSFFFAGIFPAMDRDGGFQVRCPQKNKINHPTSYVPYSYRPSSKAGDEKGSESAPEAQKKEYCSKTTRQVGLSLGDAVGRRLL